MNFTDSGNRQMLSGLLQYDNLKVQSTFILNLCCQMKGGGVEIKMKKEYLNSCLSKVFTRTGGAYYINDIDFLQTLIALLAYYSDGDLSDDLCADINQLHAILLNCDLYKQSKGRERIPTDFTCRLDMIGMRNGNSLPQFTFAPHVNVSFPEAKEDTLKSLSEELAALNLAALTQYVRNKAYAAGDLVLE